MHMHAHKCIYTHRQIGYIGYIDSKEQGLWATSEAKPGQPQGDPGAGSSLNSISLMNGPGCFNVSEK